MLRFESQGCAFPVASMTPAAFLTQMFRVPVPNMLPLSPWVGEVAKTMEPVSRAAQRAQYETLSLVGQQARTALDFPRHLAVCRTPQDVAATTAQFWQASVEQQIEGSRRIMDAWASAWQRAADHGAEDGSGNRARDVLAFPDAPSTVADPARKPSGLRAAAAE
jgi:hypothetical protein